MHSTTHTQKESKKVSIPKTKTKNESKYLFNRCRVFPWAEKTNLIGRKNQICHFCILTKKGGSRFYRQTPANSFFNPLLLNNKIKRKIKIDVATHRPCFKLEPNREEKIITLLVSSVGVPLLRLFGKMCLMLKREQLCKRFSVNRTRMYLLNKSIRIGNVR